MRKKDFSSTLLKSLLLSAISFSTQAATVTNSNFTEIDSILYNPGIGLSDFHHVSPFPYPATAHPTGKVAYYRFTWSDLESTQGVYDFSKIDKALAIAQSRGQLLGLRVMSATRDNNAVQIPAYLAGASNSNGTWINRATSQVSTSTDSNAYFFPNYSNPNIIGAANDLLVALGKKYANDPRLGFVDVGIVGVWGEWHDGAGETFMPDLAVRKQYVDMHANAFPNKPISMLIGSGQQTANDLLSYAVSKKLGWRADCWGDYTYFDPQFIGWKSNYPDILNKVSGMSDAWKTNPVLLETCGTIQSLYNMSYSLPNGTPAVNDTQKMQAMIQFAIDQHASSINFHAADSNIPTSWQPMFHDMLKKLGYRFVLRQVSHPDVVDNGGQISLSSTWDNVGNAPAYNNFRLSYRLRRDDGAIVWQKDSATNLKTWLPGLPQKVDATTTALVNHNWAKLNTPAGTYKLDVAILGEEGNHPAVALAIAGQRSDGWYEVSSLKLQTQQDIESAQVPYNESSSQYIYDNDVNTGWHNGGVLGNGTILLKLIKKSTINAITYKDDYSRNLKLEAGPTPDSMTSVGKCTAGGSGSTSSICKFNNPVVGAQYIRVSLDYPTLPPTAQIWMVPEDIKVMELP